MSYYLLLNNEQAGPYSLTQLQGMWKNGAITSQTLYWQEGQSEWITLDSLVEDAINEERRRAAIAAAPRPPKEEEISVLDRVIAIVASLLLTLIALLIGIGYTIAGKKKRGAMWIGWSLFWICLYVLAYVFAPNLFLL